MDDVKLCFLAQHAMSQSHLELNGSQMESLSTLWAVSSIEPWHAPRIGAPGLPKGNWLITTKRVDSESSTSDWVIGCAESSSSGIDSSESHTTLAEWSARSSLLKISNALASIVSVGSASSSRSMLLSSEMYGLVRQLHANLQIHLH